MKASLLKLAVISLFENSWAGTKNERLTTLKIYVSFQHTNHAHSSRSYSESRMFWTFPSRIDALGRKEERRSGSSENSIRLVLIMKLLETRCYYHKKQGKYYCIPAFTSNAVIIVAGSFLHSYKKFGWKGTKTQRDSKKTWKRKSSIPSSCSKISRLMVF